jgi:hypothetical protein
MSAVITGLVSLIKGYMTYRNEKQKIEQEGKQATEPPKAAQEGEQALQTVQQGVARHGNAGEQNDLASFESDPTSERRIRNLIASLEELSAREPDFAALLRQSEQKLPTLHQHMEGENLRNVRQEISGKQGDHQQDMLADKDIEGGSQIIT